MTGFSGLGDRVSGGYQYICDGMPTLMGCGQIVTVPRRWTRVGYKKSGWLVIYGLEPKPEFGNRAHFDEPDQWQPDPDTVLTFCSRCAAVVKEQNDRKGLKTP